MKKARVIKSFYYAKGKELYLDEERFNELKEQGLVEEVNQVETASLNKDKKKAIEITEGYSKKGGTNSTIPNIEMSKPPSIKK